MMQQQYFIEQALTYGEAEKKARDKYGEKLTILMHETVQLRGGPFKLFPREGVKIMGVIPRNRPSQWEASALAKPAPAKEPLDLQRTGLEAGSSAQSRPAQQLNWPQKDALNFQEEKGKILAAAGRDGAIKEVLDYVKTIKEKLDEQGLAGSREEHPALNRIDDLLILNDFTPGYRKSLMERVRKEFSLDALNNSGIIEEKVLEWIGESVKVHENKVFNVRPRIMILVGPTGVGKTTTVAKLAANFGIDDKGNHKRNIVLISIDAYRIGAREQLEKYSSWMEFPFYSTADSDELRKIIRDRSEDTDLFLIDTIGKNPRDMVKLGEMKELLDACGTVTEVHLVVAATTKASDLAEIFRQFEAFNYRSVIITKMDETSRSGSMISVLSEKGKSVSYITNGQTVPTDIRKASAVQLLANLEGFRVNRAKLEEKFPDKGQEQMQQWR